MIREIVNAALSDLSKTFSELPHFGRSPIAPERLLRAMLLQVLHGNRRVPGGVSKIVVDALEMVDVEEHERRSLLDVTALDEV